MPRPFQGDIQLDVGYGLFGIVARALYGLVAGRTIFANRLQGTRDPASRRKGGSHAEREAEHPGAVGR
jgi:hypothetical protein